MAENSSPGTPNRPPNLKLDPRAALLICIRKYITADGRATRAEFWWWILTTTALSLALSLLGSLYATLFSMLVLLPTLTVTARRLHDTGKTGWWQLAWLALHGVGATIAITGLLAGAVMLANLGMLDQGDVDLIQEGAGWDIVDTIDTQVILPALTITGTGLLLALATQIWALLWLIRPSEVRPNRYGPDPREPVAPAMPENNAADRETATWPAVKE